MKDRSIAVLGLGEYGSSLARELHARGADVMVVDKDPRLVQDFADKAAAAVCADLSDEDALNEMGLEQMDAVIICMGADLGPSALAAAVAKEKGVPLVMAKAATDHIASILKRVGADRVVKPEEESGRRTARMLMASNFLELFEVDDEFCIAELKPKKKWLGKSLRELQLRQKELVYVIAVRTPSRSWTLADADTPLTEDMLLLAALEEEGTCCS